ncbi:hypothetical protein [Novosphingobium sp.]|uniref:hypothetical protein n=1 Tax=Novosphingobium sp. TaxID=1874826 RepID=UPI002B4808C0|nr:hypothetical protein [Novosphingobium sp.]HKR92168.1 hypothetical protein [Novosphingobium sp.]
MTTHHSSPGTSKGHSNEPFCKCKIGFQNLRDRQAFTIPRHRVGPIRIPFDSRNRARLPKVQINARTACRSNHFSIFSSFFQRYDLYFSGILKKLPAASEAPSIDGQRIDILRPLPAILDNGPVAAPTIGARSAVIHLR